MPITKSKSRGGFVQLGNYIAQEKDLKDMEWGCSENLSYIRNYDNLFKVMTGTASRSPNADRIKPVYHLIISYDPEDRDKLTKEMKDEIAHQAAEALGFGDGYQYVFAHHEDKDHDHTHFVGNKVHPDTHKSLKLYKDHARLRKFAREMERKYGLTPTIEKKEEWEVSQEDEEFFEALDGPIHNVLEKSNSWAELKNELAKHKLDIKKRGRGAIIYSQNDENKKIKVSHFGRQYAYGKLCKAYGEDLDRYDRRQAAKERSTFEDRLEYYNFTKDNMTDKERLIETNSLIKELTEGSQAQRDREEKLQGYRTLNSPEYIEGQKLKSQEYIEGDKVINDYKTMKDNLGKYNDAQAAEKALQDLNTQSQDAADNIKKLELQARRDKKHTIRHSR